MDLKKTDLKKLEYFVKVAELGSFTKASVALGIRQPEISRKISQLEVELHQRLFNRHGRGIRLTDEGTIMLNHCLGILNQIERMYQEVSAARNSPVGKVVIGTTASTGEALAPFIIDFQQRFPNASLEIVSGRSLVLHEWVITGRVDIAIILDPSPSPLLEAVHLYEIELLLVSLSTHTVAPKTGPVTFRSLAKLPLILPGKFHWIRKLVESEAQKAGIKLDVVLEVEGAGLILELIQRRKGYTVRPALSVERNSTSRRLQLNPIVSPKLKRSVKLVMSKQQPTSYLIRQTFAMIRDSFTQDAGKP